MRGIDGGRLAGRRRPFLASRNSQCESKRDVDRVTARGVWWPALMSVAEAVSDRTSGTECTSGWRREFAFAEGGRSNSGLTATRRDLELGDARKVERERSLRLDALVPLRDQPLPRRREPDDRDASGRPRLCSESEVRSMTSGSGMCARGGGSTVGRAFAGAIADEALGPVESDPEDL